MATATLEPTTARDNRQRPTAARLRGTAFVLGGSLIAAGSALRWFAPGYDIDSRLGNAMSPLIPEVGTTAVPGSVELTAAGYLCLAVAWLLLIGIGASAWSRIVLAVAAVPAFAYAAQVVWAASVSLLSGGREALDVWGITPLVQIPASAYELGVSWLLTAVFLATRTARPRPVMAGVLLLTVPVVEMIVLHLVAAVVGIERFQGWDDPYGLGVLAGLAYVLFGALLHVERSGRSTSPTAPLDRRRGRRGRRRCPRQRL